ncbi:MAG: ferrous iron transporter B [Oligoflexia bacterium]|nr:ferrous iron transporter B [Oligoflexia bacterium]
MSAPKKKILLIGPPNSGKTTLFNWLTGFKHKTVNYPGSTVLTGKGELLKKYNLPSQIIDTPGTYSLCAQSEDEQITCQTLFENKKNFVVVLVLDSSKLEIQLPLFFQLKSAGFPLVIALTMPDITKKSSQLNKDILTQHLKTPVVSVNGLTGEGVFQLITKVKELKIKKLAIKKLENWSEKQFNQVSHQSRQIIKKSLFKNNPQTENLFYSHKWDRFFLHPKIGFILFAFIMFFLFSSIFWLAEPFMAGIDEGFSFLIDQSRSLLSFQPVLAEWFSNGVLASFGSVMVFVPQIFILFIGISLLEDTGYLARAVALMDGPLSKIGLSGRSFIPFLSAYACAIPAILLARNISSKKEKFLVYFSAPFMTCSARLPVYALLLSFLFYGQSAWKPGLALSFIYIFSFILGIISVMILNLVVKQKDKESFLLDLPIYRRPAFAKIFSKAFTRTKHYITSAGPAIFLVALGIWILSYFPLAPGLSPEQRIQQSYASQLGQIFEPLFQNMGLDWRVGLALITAFAAREVFVSSLVLIFTVVKTGDNTLGHSLLETMQTAVHTNGADIFTTASVMALIVFFMFSLQCLSTTALVYKESRSLKLAVSQFLALNGLAYVSAVVCYQVLSLFS